MFLISVSFLEACTILGVAWIAALAQRQLLLYQLIQFIDLQLISEFDPSIHYVLISDCFASVDIVSDVIIDDGNTLIKCFYAYLSSWLKYRGEGDPCSLF